MSRFLRMAGFLLLLSACGASVYAPPRNLDNACSIVSERPAYLKAMKRTERRWGIPVEVQMATIYQESKFIGNARTPRKFFLGIIPTGRQSSAYGYAQAVDGTWEEYQRKTRNYRARRNNINDATDFIGWYMAQTSERLGISKRDAGLQYLAYHEGRGGFARGSYRAKPWLMRVAREVDARAEMYGRQLRACGLA